MPVLERVLGLGQALGQVLVQVPVLEQGLPALGQAALAWVLDQGQALVKEALGLVALKDRTDLDPVMEPAMVVLVRQTVQALARAAAGTSETLFSFSKNSPHPNVRPQSGSACKGEGISVKQ